MTKTDVTIEVTDSDTEGRPIEFKAYIVTDDGKGSAGWRMRYGQLHHGNKETMQIMGGTLAPWEWEAVRCALANEPGVY